MSYNVAVVGATGAVGREMLQTLFERKFPVKNIYALASRSSVGKIYSINWFVSLFLFQFSKIKFSEKINKSFFCSSIIIGINKKLFLLGIDGKMLFFSRKLNIFFFLNDNLNFN